MSAQQISVFLENKPGQLAEVTSLLAENGINLKALNIAETSSYGVLRLITDNTARTEKILSEHGWVSSLTPVVPVLVPDTPGGLSAVLRILAEHNIDIEYMYSVLGGHSKKACMIFRVGNPENTYAVLKKNGIETLD